MADREFWAAVFACAAAARLMLWRWHVRRDQRWLAEQFGPSQNDQEIAEAASMFWAIGFASVSALVLWL